MAIKSEHEITLTKVGVGYGGTVRVGNVRLDLGVFPRGGTWYYVIYRWDNQTSARSLRRPTNGEMIAEGTASTMQDVIDAYDREITIVRDSQRSRGVRANITHREEV